VDRKKFLHHFFVIGAGLGITKNVLGQKKDTKSTYRQMIEQVGFNHLPQKNTHTMNSVFHKASSRGHADHGWLKSHHSFSFASYYNPDRMHFGVLRVLNDDHVEGGKGFGTHPHDNMEIVSIPLQGDLEHKDSMGNTTVIKEGDIQVMSAGTGIYHSEYNKNQHQAVKFLQIWLFPNKKNVQPRYDQISLNEKSIQNQFFQILSPNPEDEGVWIHQNAWFHLGKFTENKEIIQTLKHPNNGLYVFQIEGKSTIGNQTLEKRDGLGIWDIKNITIQANEGSKILLMEVPMRMG